MSELDLEVVVRPDRYQAVQRPRQDYVPAAQPSSTGAELAGHPRDAAGGAAHGGGARGHDHPHAVRILARAWIRVIYRCWNDRIPYDPTLHGNAQRLHQQLAAA